MNKKLIFPCIAVILALAFILMPLPASDIIIRVYFDEISGSSCSLYYSTEPDGSFSQEQCLTSEIDYTQKQVEFRLDGSLENKLTGLRLDFPALEQLICIKNVTASSAGVIKRSFNPCDFFGDENIAAANETVFSHVVIRDRSYASTGGTDPYVVFSAPLLKRIQNCYSHQVLSRLFLCLFVGACFWFSRKKLFS